MSKTVKAVVKRYRNRLLGNISQSLGEIKELLRVASGERLNINHHQLEVLNETNQRLKNSGTLVLSSSEIVTKIFSGLKMYLDPSDIAVVPHLALDAIWEHHITSAWLATIRPQDTVVDIGANFGYFGILAAQKTDKKKSKIVLFEANPNLIPYLRKTVSVNWLNEQTTIENMAITESSGKVTLNVLKDYTSSSSLHSAEEIKRYMDSKMAVEVNQRITVPATSLDEYCHKHGIKNVDLIKMDIEGFEDKAYAGMRDIVKSSTGLTLFVEFTKGAYRDPKGFYELMLKDFGNVYTIDEEGYITKPKHQDYASVIGDSDDWVMPVFSKRSNLATR